MAYRPQFASPVMRAAARLQCHQTARVSSEEVEQLAARDLPTEHGTPRRIRSVRVKNMLGDIQPDRGNL